MTTLTWKRSAELKCLGNCGASGLESTCGSFVIKTNEVRVLRQYVKMFDLVADGQLVARFNTQKAAKAKADSMAMATPATFP